MIRSTLLRQTALAVTLIIVLFLAISAPAVAASVGEDAILPNLADQSAEQAQRDTNTSQQNASSANATVEFQNQTVNGSSVTVESVTLPTSGFVVVDLSGAGVEGLLEEDAVAVSNHLSAGTHRNLTIPINQSPPGGVANRTSLNNTGNYEVIVYEDSNNNTRFEYLTSGTTVDQPVIVGSGEEERVVADSARLTIRGSRGDPNATPTPSADIQFADQQVNSSSVTVESVTLPQGGFVVVHDEGYLRGGDPTQTAIGISRYLPAGTHRNVSVSLINGSVQQAQTLIAIPSRDTDGNQTYDYVRSDGFQDVPYTAENERITDQAAVTFGGDGATPSSNASSSSQTQSSSSTTTSGPASGEAASGSGEGDDWFDVSLPVAIVLLAGFVVFLTIMRRVYG